MLLQLTTLLFLLTLVSGIGQIGTPPDQAQSSAVLAWLHVVIGWAALPVFVTFATIHTYQRWRPAVRTRRQSGSMGLVTLAMLLLSGIEIEERLTGLPMSLAGQLHLWTTFALLIFLAVHLWPLLGRRLRNRKRRR